MAFLSTSSTNSVMGSIFTRYKTNALVNLDWTTTFTPQLLRKDMDLGPWRRSQPESADAGHCGHARGAAKPISASHTQTDDPEGYPREGFRDAAPKRGKRNRGIS